MKTLSEIKKEIEALKVSKIDESKAEKELNRAAIRAANTDDERAEALKKYRASEARYNEALQKNNEIKMQLEILKDNAAQALFNEIFPTICDIWNKYEGKPHGEKTREKIYNEIKAATGYGVHIGNRYDNGEITIYSYHHDIFGGNDIKISGKYDSGNGHKVLIENKIQKITPDNFYLSYRGEYVEDVKKHLEAIKEAHKKALEAQTALDDAISIYNHLTRGKMQHASRSEGVKNWILI